MKLWKKLAAAAGWIVAAVLVFLRIQSRPAITVTPGKVEQPPDKPQDLSGTLTRDELAALAAKIKGDP